MGLPPFGMGILYCAHFGKSYTSWSVFVSNYSWSHSSVDGVLVQHAQGPGLNPQDPVTRYALIPAFKDRGTRTEVQGHPWLHSKFE